MNHLDLIWNFITLPYNKTWQIQGIMNTYVNK